MRALAAAITVASELLPDRAAAVLVTGDIAHTGSDEEYEQARTLIERLNAPIFALPGNHDDRAHCVAASGCRIREEPI